MPDILPSAPFEAHGYRWELMSFHNNQPGHASAFAKINGIWVHYDDQQVFPHANPFKDPSEIGTVWFHVTPLPKK